MDSKLIQKRVDDLAVAMTAKGMREPHVQAEFKANEESRVYIKRKRGLGRDLLGGECYEFFTGEIGAALEKASAFIAEEPNAEEAKLNDFMAALGGVIDLGRQHNIETDFLNPLVATMKRLSENALTDQRAA
ncbi:MAG: hypothetical protein AB7I42_25105 [Bradyrhizobium sp.]|uniref:hypothetical protein n=1 Tax=Bradyrhizobium sp. TaxID=376 RepID=UPI003D0CD839